MHHREMRSAAAALAVLILALPSWGAQPRPASLQLVQRAPLTVAGRGFSGREPVTLTAAARGAVRSVAVTSGRNGRFRVRFDLRLTRCSAFVVRAVGRLGSRAILQVEPGCKPQQKPKQS